jgi:hypothetical protein
MKVAARRLGAVLGAVVASVGAASPALAVTPVTCLNLATTINSGATVDGTVLQLPAGTCSTNVSVTNTAAFTLEGTNGQTVLEPSNSSQSIVSTTAAAKFTLSGLEFSGASSASAVTLNGVGEVVTLTHNVFSGNHTTTESGAAVQIQPFGSPASQPTVISDNTFAGNRALIGGAIAVFAQPPSLVITGNTFTGNAATQGMYGDGGGAIGIFTSLNTTTPVTISGNTFGGPAAVDGNTALNDGGALDLVLHSTQLLTLSSNTFENNRITGVNTATGDRLGGAVFIGPEASSPPFAVIQTHNKFLNNVIDETQATPTPKLDAGGAGEWVQGANVSSIGDEFIGNRVAANDGNPPEGGGVGVYAVAVDNPTPAEPGMFAGSDDLFKGNSVAAGGWGGAIYVGYEPTETCATSCPASTISINDSTIVSNATDPGAGSEGGAVWGSPGDHLTLHNSIEFGNSKPELFGFEASSPNIGFSDACSEPGGVPIPTSAGNICADPKLAASGAETAASPTVDAGDNGLVPFGVSTDFAGAARVRASRLTCAGALHSPVVDLGAFEFTATIPACDLVNPVVRIGSGKLHAKHGHVKVKLSCPAKQSFCDGTVRLAHGKVGLGKAHFHIAGGKSATVKIGLSSKGLGKLGNANTTHVTVNASDHDAAKRHASSHRTVKLKLKVG